MATRASQLAVLLLFLTPASSADNSQLKLVATVALPCESMYQEISPSGDQVALDCPDRSVKLVSTGSGALQHTFQPEPRIESHTFSSDGRSFAVGRWDGTVEIVSALVPAAGAKQFRTGPRVETLNFFPDGNGIIVGNIDGPGQVWDLSADPKHVADLQEDFGGLLACEFSRDGKLLVTADGDTAIRFYDTATWRIVREYRGLLLETFAVAFADDDKRVLIGGPDDHITELDLSGAELRRLDKETDVIQQILPVSSRQAIVVYSDAEGRRPPHTSFWDMETGKSSPLGMDSAPTGAGVVREGKVRGGGITAGTLWLTRASGNSLQVFEYVKQTTKATQGNDKEKPQATADH
jgi:WD40 repeat protein